MIINEGGPKNDDVLSELQKYLKSDKNTTNAGDCIVLYSLNGTIAKRVATPVGISFGGIILKTAALEELHLPYFTDIYIGKKDIIEKYVVIDSI
jgi:hypothetical protein